MRFGVLQFPGTNCEQDAVHALQYLGQEAQFVWHKESDLRGFDAVVLPGGFSYGDYLRSGAIARFAPVMTELVHFAKQGRPVIGICNGFQILTEAQLLPGALIRNAHMKFLCQTVHLKVQKSPCQWLGLQAGDLVDIPISHHDGNYHCSDECLEELLEHEQIVLRYCEEDGQILERSAPNGSKYSIAGICNRQGNVFGLMPHPERVVDGVAGSSAGVSFFTGLIDRWN